MRQPYFVDTWYFVARASLSDSHHLRAKRLARHIPTRDIVTHDGVLTELLAYFSDEGAQARATAAEAVRNAIRDFTVITPDRVLFLRALELYAHRLDKAYSLVDCMSMVIMRDRKIDHVLTNDRHFAQEGFVLVSDAP